MVANQIVQNTLQEIATITQVDAAVFDISGKMVAIRGDMTGFDEKAVSAFLRSGEVSQELGDYLFGTIGDNGETEFVAVVRKDADNAGMALRLIVVQIESLIQAYKEKLDKDSFVKNLLLDNLLQIDIFNRAKKLHIEFKQPRAVFIIETRGHDSSVGELLRQMVSTQSNDFVTSIDEENQVIVHELKERAQADAELKEEATQIYNMLAEAGIETKISYGSAVEELKDVSKSYKEAKLAHDVRRIFYEDEDVIAYSGLGIGRLIYQLPINLCRMFISEIFGGRTMDEFDDETLATINKFFENNLNVSETSRQLFIHRNTLVYRLDKLQKTTGLDLRIFDDAITFKIALMVVKYMDYMDRIDY